MACLIFEAMLIPSLTFNGNTEEAFNFYKSALGGQFTTVMRVGDTEMGANLPDSGKNKIMHISLDAPHGIKLIGNDHMDFGGQPYVAGNNITLSLHPDNKELADELFNRLSAGGTITMPMDKVFWGAYFGMFTDKFGIQWMINSQDK